METVKLGTLKTGDTFYFEGQKYEAHVSDVVCINLQTHERKWLGQGTEVQVSEKE